MESRSKGIRILHAKRTNVITMDIGTRKLNTHIGTGGIGWIVVPDPAVREDYIRDCYRTGTVTMHGGQGYGFFEGVRCPNHVMQELQWPTDENERGTTVVWIRDAMTQLPVIVAWVRLDGDYYQMGENQYHLKRSFGDNIVDIFIDGNTSTMQVNVTGTEEYPAKMNIKLSSEDKSSVFTLSSDNKIQLVAEQKAEIISYDEIQLTVKDGNEVKGSFTYKQGTGFTFSDENGNKVETKDGSFNIDGNPLVQVNGGKNAGAVNIAQIRSLAQALLKDLLIAGSGGNLSSWMGSEMPKAEDKNFTH